MSWGNWLRGRLRRPMRQPTVRRSRPSLEELESRLAPASAITVVPGAAGTGSLDSFLSPTNGTLSPADGGNNPGTLSTGALVQVGSGVDVSIGAQVSITFSDLGGTLALQTGPGHAATFYTTGASADFITFANTNNTLATVGGDIVFNAATNLTLAGLSSGGGAISGTTANGNLTVGGNESAGAAPVSLTAGGTDMMLTNNAAITGDAATLTADRMVLDSGTINAGTGAANIVTLAPFSSGRPVNLDSTAGDPTGELRLSHAELNTITAGVLRVGGITAGNVTVGTPISAPPTWSTLSLISNPASGTIGEISFGGVLKVPSLALQAYSAGLTKGGIASQNEVSTLAANVSTNLTVYDQVSLTIGTVDGVQGITATSSIQLYGSASNTELTVNQPITVNNASPDAGASLSLSFDNMAINAALNAGLPGSTSSGVGLGPVSHGQAIDVGGADGPGALGLTAAELDEVHTPGGLSLGNFTADITISAAIDATGHFGSLALITQGAVVEAPGGMLTVPSLRVIANNGVGSGTPLATQIGSLSVENFRGDVGVHNTGPEDLTVTGISGTFVTGPNSDPINRVQGNVAISTDAGLTVAGFISATGEVTLTGGAAGQGSAITVQATLISFAATLRGGAGADTITLNAAASSILTVDGQGGGDVYQINLGNLGSPVNIDATGGGDNTVTINSTPAAATLVVTPTEVTWDGSETITYSGVQSLTVNGGACGNTFLVQGTAATTPALLNTGAGNDTVYVSSQVGNGGDLSELQGALTVDGQGGSNLLVVSEAGRQGADTVTLTDHSISGPGFAINYTATGGSFAGVNFAGGGGNDRVNVQSSAAGATTAVYNFGGSDTIDVCSDTATNMGDLTGLKGLLLVEALAGSDLLVVSEAGRQTADDVTVTGSSISSATGPGFTIGYAAASGASLAGINFASGAGNDTVNVTGAPAGVLVGLYTFGGSDTVNVTTTPDGAADLLVDEGPPSGGTAGDVLTVTDLSGTAVVYNMPLGPDAGLVRMMYAGGRESDVMYQDVEQVSTNPAAS